jgi:adenosylhomocysteine nucleosidase
MLRRSFLAAGLGSTAAQGAARAAVLVQGAVDSELEPLLAALDKRRENRIDAWTFWEGRIAKQPVVVSRTEVGPINAVAATILGIRAYHPKLVINQGTAGAHNEQLQLWDIVLGERTSDFSAYETVHMDDEAGVRPRDWKPKGHALRVDGKTMQAFPVFVGDEAAMRVAMTVKNPRGRVLKGTIGSAYQWNREIDMIQAIRARHGTDTEDMESAFAHGAAVGLRTPFLAVRIVSDSEFHHPKFERIAGQYCAEFVLEMIRKLLA